MRHHCVAVTFLDLYMVMAVEIRDKLASDKDFGNLVTPIVGPCINGYASFFVAPDGSKEEWELSNDGDEFREWVVREVSRIPNASWAVVQYGDDGFSTQVVDDSDTRYREDK